MTVDDLQEMRGIEMEIRRLTKKVGVAIALTTLIIASSCATAQEETTEPQMMQMPADMQQMHDQMMTQMRDCMSMPMSEGEEMEGMRHDPAGSTDETAQQEMRQRMMAHMQNCMEQMQVGDGMPGMMQQGQDSSEE